MLLLLHDYLVVGAIAVQYRKCNAQVLIQVDNYSYYFLTTTTTGETNSRSTIVMCGAVAGANCWPVIVFIFVCFICHNLYRTVSPVLSINRATERALARSKDG
jgi:hypothetical protein